MQIDLRQFLEQNATAPRNNVEGRNVVMVKIEMQGVEIEVGGGALFMSVPGVGEVWAEILTNADHPRPFGWWWTETGSMIVEWGKVHLVLSPCVRPVQAPAA